MKKIFFVLLPVVFVFFTSCNNSEKKTDSLQIKADSLEKEVIEGHNIAMPKSMKIPNLQKEAKQLLDSINKLPAKEQQASVSYKEKLETLLKDLDDAYAAMDKWMNEFNLDSFKNNTEQRIQYLSEEKMKVGNVKEALLSSLQKDDSILKKKN